MRKVCAFFEKVGVLIGLISHLKGKIRALMRKIGLLKGKDAHISL